MGRTNRNKKYKRDRNDNNELAFERSQHKRKKIRGPKPPRDGACVAGFDGRNYLQCPCPDCEALIDAEYLMDEEY